MPDLAVAIAALVLQGVAIIIAGVWKLGSVRDELKDVINAHRLEVEKKIDNETDQVRREVGETISALKEKVTQIELYVRDTYVSKNSFNTVLERILSELKNVSEKFENRCMKLETEIKTYLHESRGQP